MNWKLWKLKICGSGENTEINEDLDKLDEELAKAEEKLQEVKDMLPSLARATASARRVRYNVDKFTKSYGNSFGRTNHG